MSTETSCGNSLRQVVDFYDRLIFGGPHLPSAAAVTSHIAQIYVNAAKKRLEARNLKYETVAQLGGLVKFGENVCDDARKLLGYVERGNARFQSATTTVSPPEDAEPLPRFDTDVVRVIALELASTCGGKLDYGLSSNRRVHDQVRAAYYGEGPFARYLQQQDDDDDDDEKTLMALVEGRQQGTVLRFHDANFWGKIARSLMERREHYTARKRDVPDENVDYLIWLYEQKCRSAGRIIDPFSLELRTAQPMEWDSLEALLFFVVREPGDPVSVIVRQLCEKLTAAMFAADIGPFAVLFDEATARKYANFASNVNAIDVVLPRVSSMRVPAKLVDVFQRLLAFTKHDGLWREVDFDYDAQYEAWKKKGAPYARLYARAVALERELREARKNSRRDVISED